MFRLRESKTVFWRSSWYGGAGCSWRGSRIRFMGTSFPFGGEESPLTALLQRGQEPSGRLPRPVARYSKRAEGGTHRPCANCIKADLPLQHDATALQGY